MSATRVRTLSAKRGDTAWTHPRRERLADVAATVILATPGRIDAFDRCRRSRRRRARSSSESGTRRRRGPVGGGLRPFERQLEIAEQAHFGGIRRRCLGGGLIGPRGGLDEHPEGRLA